MAQLQSGLGGSAGFGEGIFSSAPKAVGGNDDGSVAVDISSVFGSGGLEFFGQSYTTLYVNSNGLVSFGGADDSYAAGNLSQAAHPSIAVFWADHNIDAGGEIFWDLDATQGKVTVTWHDVAPYSGTGENSYQVVISKTGDGDFDIELIYEKIEWTDGGGQRALAGITDGGSEHHPLEGSGNPNALDDFPSTDFGGGSAGTQSFSIVDGAVQNLNGIVEGGSSDDTFVLATADEGGDAITKGADAVQSGAGDDYVHADDGDDTVHGGTGSDTILGGDGADEIHGDGIDNSASQSSTTSITSGNVSDTTSGFSVSARNIDNGGVTSASSANVSTTMGGFGAGGTVSHTDSGVSEQTGFDLASGFSEELIVEFDEPIDEVTFSFTALYTASYGEEAEWAIYNNGSLVAQSSFSEQSFGSGDGTINLSGYGQFDQIIFRGLPQTDGTDGSDFLITEVSFATPDPASASDDSLSGGDGTDLIYGGVGEDTISGDADNDTIYGEDGNDSISGGTGNDSVLGGDGADTISGGDGDDYIEGGAGDDLLTTGIGNDTLIGGEGDDTLQNSSGDDSLVGGTGNDQIIATEGDDTLEGGSGDDTLDGGADNDLLFGGTGDDSLTGGAGDDVFTYSAGDGHDTISDFNAGNSGALGDGDTSNNDFINLSGHYDNIEELREDFADDGVLNQSNSLGNGGTVDYSDNTQFGATDSLTFQGASQSSFTSDNTGIVCFTKGTLIETGEGPRPIEALAVGDVIVTRDNGEQPIIWTGQRSLGPDALTQAAHLKPILISPRFLGTKKPLLVSPQHGILLVKDGEERLARAKHLALLPGDVARVAHGAKEVVYYHLMFADHQIVYSNGAPTESFYPGKQALRMLSASSRSAVLGLVPGLASGQVAESYGRRARPFLKRSELSTAWRSPVSAGNRHQDDDQTVDLRRTLQPVGS